MSVFPLPGGPTSSTPLGARAPLALNFSGVRKKSTTSISSTWGQRRKEGSASAKQQRQWQPSLLRQAVCDGHVPGPCGRAMCEEGQEEGQHQARRHRQ